MPKILNKFSQALVLAYNKDSAPNHDRTISVNPVVAELATWYEKFRTAMDYNADEVILRSAIERILKRRLFLAGDTLDFAEGFLQELVRGGHFPNDRIPVVAIEVVQQVVNKYAVLIKAAQDKVSGLLFPQLKNWLLSVAAAEVEETLAPPYKEKALIDFMTADMAQKINLQKDKELKLDDATENLQIFIAVQRALFKLDNETISCHLLEKFYQDWKNPSRETLNAASQNIESIYKDMLGLLSHPLSGKFYAAAERYDTPYLLLGDILAKKPMEYKQVSEDPQALEAEINDAYQSRLIKLKK